MNYRVEWLNNDLGVPMAFLYPSAGARVDPAPTSDGVYLKEGWRRLKTGELIPFTLSEFMTTKWDLEQGAEVTRRCRAFAKSLDASLGGDPHPSYKTFWLSLVPLLGKGAE